MVRDSAGTSSSSASRTSSLTNPSRLCVGATPRFERPFHNVLVGVPEAMHYDGSVRHRNVIANIALNSMQIFALSHFPGNLSPANTTACMSVQNPEGISVACRQEFRITTPILPLLALVFVDSDKMSSRRWVRKLAV
ncbi:hypothetical protein T12_6812 [Trichinella patagoniensis]|uniref:Uncharacterized protein n=1 Tax=Trichinella patagoniensis TaxID=990121 RepID=A0A0V0Z5B0_9BILA|nr:hypothetical protein T12_6812 [Trichinella patagoniensis]